MGAPILATKLFIPSLHTDLVPRTRLVDKLNVGKNQKLILVSAPAGYGKTTVIVNWLTQIPRTSAKNFAWISLDESDNDLFRFLAYIVAALQSIEFERFKNLTGLLQSTQPAPIETILTILINDLTSIGYECILVLDDYHVIHKQDIHDVMLFLLDNIPDCLQIVIASRSKLPLPISNYRSRGHLLELTTKDLQFTNQETEILLNQVMDLDLSKEEVEILNQRTEGWVSGLKLAAFSIQKFGTRGLIHSLNGNDLYITDYLIEEVFDQQPADLRRFLLQTSILERMSAMLCDTVTGREDSHRILEYLEESNLFIIPLDNTRSWFRYQQLFSGFLQNRLNLSDPDLASRLYLKAGKWCESHNLMEEAIAYAIKAGDSEYAENLIGEVGWPEIWQGRASTVAGWLNALPMDIIRASYDLWGMYVGAEILMGELSLAEESLNELFSKDIEKVRRPKKEDNRSWAQAATLRAAIALYRSSDAALAADFSRKALELIPGDDLISQAIAALFYGEASIHTGDLLAAGRALNQAIFLWRENGNVPWIILSLGNLAELEAARGRLKRARDLFGEAEQLAIENGYQEHTFFTKTTIGLGRIFYEWNDLTTSLTYLGKGIKIAERTGFVDHLLPGYTTLVRIQLALGTIHDARDTLMRARSIARKHGHPKMVVDWIEALAARIQLADGKLRNATSWKDDSGFNTKSEINNLKEFELITLCNVLIASNEYEQAIYFLERMIELALQQDRLRSATRLQALLARTLYLKGEETQARKLLHKLIEEAEPENYVRTFIDEGDPIRSMLLKIAKDNHEEDFTSNGSARSYLRNLLSGYVEENRYLRLDEKTSHISGLFERLTSREIDILTHVAQGLSNEEIAEEEVVTINTIKWHLKNIYGKLGVDRRTQAIKRGKELGLI